MYMTMLRVTRSWRSLDQSEESAPLLGESPCSLVCKRRPGGLKRPIWSSCPRWLLENTDSGGATVANNRSPAWQ